MARKTKEEKEAAKAKAAEIIEAESGEGEETEKASEAKPAEVAGETTGAPPPRRGRPKGSKNAKKSKANPFANVPPEVAEQLAMLPLIALSEVSKATAGVPLRYSEPSLKVCADSLRCYLASVDFDLTPGWALSIAYLSAVITAIPGAAAEYAAFEEAKAKNAKAVSAPVKVVDFPKPEEKKAEPIPAPKE